MTAPALNTVAGWNIPLLRGAVATLDGVADRLADLRGQIQDVRRALGVAAVWSGAAARSAADATDELAAVMSSVWVGFDASLEDFQRLLRHAEDAQGTALEAIALAASVGARLDDDGSLARRPAPPTVAMAPDQAGEVAARAATASAASALAAEALAAALVAQSAAESADTALRMLGVIDAFAPADFAGLTNGSFGLASVRVDPQRVAGWWAALPAAQQRAAVLADPELIGSLDGVAAWARDRANRLLLDRAGEDPASPWRGTARAVADALARGGAEGNRVQLWALDLAHGRAAIALGDLDTAEAIGVLVPGIFTTAAGDLTGMVDDARNVAEAATAAAPALTVATVAWLGYRTPNDVPEILTRGAARRGGAALDGALDGLVAARRATGRTEPRTTVLAHSYGTVVVDEAVGEEGYLQADALVLLGSPGMSRTADELEVPEVFDAVAPDDLIGRLGWFGTLPWRDAFGATELPTDYGEGHTRYFEPGYPTLAAMGRVVAGTWRE